VEAVCYSNKEAAARLLEANCDFNLREVKAGESALHVSVRKNYTIITDQLLTAGAALRPVYNYQVSVAPKIVFLLWNTNFSRFTARKNIANVIASTHYYNFAILLSLCWQMWKLRTGDVLLSVCLFVCRL